MTPEERAEARLAAGMRGAARTTDLISAGLTLLSAAALLFDFGSTRAAIVAVGLGVAGRYLGFRVVLDRRLFDDLAEGRLEIGDLDGALRAATGGKAGSVPRSIPDRCRGARRLLAMQAGVTVAQLAATTLGALLG